MATSDALIVAVDVAERKRDAARRALQDALEAQRAAQAQLDQLTGYAGETQNRWGARAGAAVQPEVMHHHYHFMDRLQHAVGLQNEVLGQHGARIDAARAALLQAELRLTSLRTVVERRQHETAQRQVRREQKQTDEWAAIQYRKTVRTQEY